MTEETQTSVAPADLTPEAAQAEIETLRGDSEFLGSLFNREAATHAAAREKWDRLHKVASGVTERSPEEIQRTREAQLSSFDGPPDDAAWYEFDRPANGEYSGELDQAARQWFHEAGIPAPTAKTISWMWNQRAANPPSAEKIESELVDVSVRLKAKWGDQYEKYSDAIDKFVEMLPDEAAVALALSGLISTEYVIDAMLEAAKRKGLVG